MTTTTMPVSRIGTRSERWFAWFWGHLDAGIDQAMEPAKKLVFTDLPTRIVEIGPGTGSNFRRYAPGTTVVAYEPNTYMHEDLRRAASEHGIDLDLRGHGAERLDLSDESVDVVVSSLTLCSVDDRSAVIREIQRVLRPGGRFVFVEHIAAVEGTVTAAVQRILRRPWSAIADRCDLMASTHVDIEAAGFSEVHTQIDGLGPKLDPSRRTVFGYAVR